MTYYQIHCIQKLDFGKCWIKICLVKLKNYDFVHLAAIGKERKCVNGAAYFDGCNWCFCSGNEGRAVGCTLKLCFDHVPQEAPASFWQE